jgi:hypothetical protein
MLTGTDLRSMAAEIMRQQNTKRDFVGDTKTMRLVPHQDTKAFGIDLGDVGQFDVNDLAHEQIGNKVGIPKAYYDRMRGEAPELLARNVNHWFGEQPEKRLVRTLDGRARAFLSDGYRPLDYFDFANATFPRLLDLKLDVKSAQLTERRMYVEAVSPRLTGMVKVGDEVQAGVIIGDSEVGCGSLYVKPFIYRLRCLNGAIFADYGMRKYHTGRRGVGENGDEGVSEWYRDDTRKADDRAFFLKVRDLIDHVLNPTTFEKILNAIRVKAGQPIEGKIEKVVEVTAKKFNLTDGERESALKHFITDGDLSGWGLANAVTATAHESKDYDRNIELQAIGGRIIELPQSEWTTLSKAS